MIKARMHGPDGKSLLLLGLSEGNVQRLKQGHPILVLGEDIGTPGSDYCILWGETEIDIIRELKSAGYLPPDYPETYDDEQENVDA
jgi:hypothetical protein